MRSTLHAERDVRIPRSPVSFACHAVRPDLARLHLRSVRRCSLIMGGDDPQVIDLNRRATRALRAEHELVIILGAPHLFEKPGALEQVAGLARDWFVHFFTATRP